MLSKLQKANQIEEDATKTPEDVSMEQRVCNPSAEIKLGQEGGAVKGWKLQGIITVIRHGDRGPMVHVRDANFVDCGVDEKGKEFLLSFLISLK